MKRKSTAVTRSVHQGFLGLNGSAAVEFAITAPMLVVFVLGIAHYGLLMGISASLEGATRAGAEVATSNPSVTAAQLTALNLFPNGVTPIVSAVTPTVSAVCTCIDNRWPTGTACPPGPLATPCSGKTNPFIAGSPVDPRVFEYVNVAATQSVSPIVSYGTFPPAMSLNVNTTIRTQ
jgi:Flp pilus assembly protein TadG